ncbi:MAG: thioesterase domain-containing protein [Verrucomicrobiota bacterium]|nr:thioesterase domain-containing protein [Verrucomicrobiota bacterium]
MMLTADELADAEAFFHAQIPLTRAMGLRVVADAENGFAIEAPVALNYNHLRTAFGGSINAVATLAGYGFLWLELRGSDAHVVVAESSMRFLRPIRETIRAVCVRPSAEELAQFRAKLSAKGTAGIRLQVRVEEEGAVAAQLNGLFVTKEGERPATH